MPSMFPTPATGGDDLNRRRGEDRTPEGQLPRSLQIGFVLLLLTAAFMILTGLIMFTSGYTGPADVDADYIEVVVNNQRFIGGVNAFAGIVIAALASQLIRGGKLPRRILLGILLLVALLDLLSFVTRAGGFALVVIVLALAVGALLIFTPSASAHIGRNHAARAAERRREL